MKKFRSLIGLLISVLFLYLALRKVNILSIIEAIKSVKLAFLAAALFLGALVLYVRGVRWKYIMGENGKTIKVNNLFAALCVGQMTNNILPFRVGDLTQAYFIGYKEKVSKSMAFSTVIIERLFDLFPPVVMIIFGSFFILLPKQLNISRLILILGALLLIVFIIVKTRARLQKILDHVLPDTKFKGKLVRLVHDFYEGLKIIKDTRLVLKIIAYTLFVWLIYVLLVYCCIYSFNIKINLLQTAVVMAIISMSVVIPSSPGYVGTWEFFAKSALAIFAVEKNLAVSFAFIYHFVAWLPVTALGLFFLIKNGISLTQIEKEDY